MNVQDFPHTTDDNAGQALIAAAGAALAKRGRDIPGTFLADLLGSAVPDDLQRYAPDELADIAERSWSLLAVRKAGAPKISFEPAPVTRTVSVLDIINDDMPFLLDSVVGELNQRGLDIRLLVHPVFAVERDAAGTLTAFNGAAKDGGRHESFIHIHIEGIAEAARRAEIVRALEDILAQVRVAVQDWRPMLEWLRAIIAELRAHPPPLDAGEIAEAVQFLEWLAADNFTLLGVARLRLHRQYRRARTDVRDRAWVVALARCAAVAALEPAARHHAGNSRAHGGASAPCHHQVDLALAGASPRRHGLYRRQAFRPARQAGR